MCGIAGFLSLTELLTDPSATLVAMAGAIAHRGPDDSGTWVDESAGLGLAHRRLSIVDLSPLGHQPMASAGGRYMVVFNGELYNFRILRGELEREGAQFRGHSDTEVLLAAVEAWGLNRALERFEGMFAFALWDTHDRVLALARDRIGEKPLYHATMGGTFLFGSELKALAQHPSWRGEIDRGALALYFRHNYIPGPHCIFAGAAKVRPGTVVRVRADSAGGFTTDVHEYWTLRDAVARGRAHRFAGSLPDATEALDALLRDVVASEMVADVPLGAFLSGGIDSSTIVGVMQAVSPTPVRTFTIGFWDKAYNEADHARRVADHLGTAHEELYVTPEQALAVIPRLPAMYDEPFADSSQIPTFLVAQLARRQVTVSVSGDGGDELFGGYTRYPQTVRLWNQLQRLPSPVRATMAALVDRAPDAVLDPAFAALSRLPGGGSLVNGTDRLRARAALWSASSLPRFYQQILSMWIAPERLMAGGAEAASVFGEPRATNGNGVDVEHLMYLDGMTYLPDDIMVKVDRASMQVSLEARAPLLHHRIVEFACSLPLEYKLHDGVGKVVLRRVLERYVPRELFDRPKRGFAIPMGDWIRGPLREWAEALLDPSRMRAEGYLDVRTVTRLWERHKAGTDDYIGQLWPVLMFQAWLESDTAMAGRTPSHAGPAVIAHA